MTVKEIVALTMAVGALLGSGGVASYFLARATSAKYLTEAAEKIVAMYQGQIDGLRDQMINEKRECSERITLLEATVQQRIDEGIERGVAAYIIKRAQRET